VRMYFNKTKSHQSTSSDDKSNTSNNNNSDNCNNDNKNSNNATTTTARIYFNEMSRRQRPQGRTEASAEQQQSTTRRRPPLPVRPSTTTGHPQLPEAISCPASDGMNKRRCKLLIPRWSSSASSFPLATTKTWGRADERTRRRQW
jgi:hypothetical protein